LSRCRTSTVATEDTTKDVVFLRDRKLELRDLPDPTPVPRDRVLAINRQMTLVGSWMFPREGQAECAAFVADRIVDVEKLFTHRWKLEQAEEAGKLFDTQTTDTAVVLSP
jgi:threonine dehydrogenase-like Zn-dependent dehydrogenase